MSPLSKEQIIDIKLKAQMSCTTFDTMRDFVVQACDELLKYETAKNKISEGVKRIKPIDGREFADGTYAKGFSNCAEIILDILNAK